MDDPKAVSNQEPHLSYILYCITVYRYMYIKILPNKIRTRIKIGFNFTVQGLILK